MIKGLKIYTFILLLVLPQQNIAIRADAIVWSDDFDDGDLEGWRAEGYYAPLVGPWTYSSTGEIANVNNVLRLSGELMFRNGTFAIHESSVAYGSWSFDLDIKSIYGSSNHTHVYFIDGRPYDSSHAFTTICCYDIMASSSQWSPSLGEVPEYTREVYELSPAIFLAKRPGVEILGYYQFENIDGWNHIEITRSNTGDFKVSINGTLRIEANDNSYMISKSFWLTGETGTFAGLDNIVVRDDFIEPTSITDNSSSQTETGISTTTEKSSDNESTMKSTSDKSNNGSTDFRLTVIFSNFILLIVVYRRNKRLTYI